MGVWAK